MSDTEQQDEFHDVEEETAFINKEITVEVQAADDEEIVAASNELDEEKSAQPADEDRTEDQVPDITGTDFVDPMTTSMDGIEELPANEEAQVVDEAPEETVEEAKEEMVDVPVETEEAPKEEETPEEAAPEDAPEQAEEAPADDELAEEPEMVEVQVESEEAPKEDTVIVEEPVAEPEEAQDEEMAPTAATPGATESEREGFELQAPPEGKRPRTPNELDKQADEEFVDAPEEIEETPATPKTAASEKPESAVGSVPPTPKTAASEKPESAVGSVPPTPKTAASEKPESIVGSVPPTPKTAASEKPESIVGSVPPTPKSAVGEAPATPKTEGSVPPTPRSAVGEAPPTPKSAIGSVPPTPRSAVGEVPGTPRSAVGSVPPTPKAANGSVLNGSIPGTPVSARPEATPKATPAATPAAEATPKATGTPKSKTAFNFEETPATPKESSVTFESAVGTPAATPKTPRTPRTPRTPKTPKTPAVAEESEPEKEPSPVPEPEPEVVEEEPQAEAETEVTEDEPVAEEEQVQEDEPQAEEAAPEPEVEESEPVAEERKQSVVEEAPSPRARAASPSPPSRQRRQSPSPERRREPAARDHVSYDQDSFREVPPPRIPTATSFSSWSPPEKSSYTPISPFVSTASKYRNDYTANCNYRPNNMYTSHFDDIVNTGAFSSALYSTTRLIERSRSRTRERRQAMRSQRSASNYYRYTSQYPAPTRAREYSTPPSRAVSRAPSRSGSFVSFMDYSGSKNGELSRNASRSSVHEGLARSCSRGSNVDLFLGGGRLSRVDSYVRDINTPYEYEVPSTYDRYRSASRPGAYSAINGYTSYTSSPSYIDTESTRRMKRYQADATPMVRSMYETRIGHLERSLSREKLNKDRLRTEYSQLSSKLNQACRQMELLRSNSYSSMRGSSLPRTNVYTHFYPYY